jgi:hypothetical protein
MKVSIVHPERRCAQHLVLDVVTPAPPAGFPQKLLPTQRFDFALAPGALIALVASAAIKPPADAAFGDLNGLLGPLVIELEAEEGEVLPEVHIYRLDTRAADFIRSHAGARAAENQREINRTIESLVSVPAPITVAGDRGQFGMLTVLVHPARDLLIAFANAHVSAVLEEHGQVSPVPA